MQPGARQWTGGSCTGLEDAKHLKPEKHLDASIWILTDPGLGLSEPDRHIRGLNGLMLCRLHTSCMVSAE